MFNFKDKTTVKMVLMVCCSIINGTETDRRPEMREMDRV